LPDADANACADACADACTDACTDALTPRHTWTDACTDTCTDAAADTCADASAHCGSWLDACADACTDACTDAPPPPPPPPPVTPVATPASGTPVPTPALPTPQPPVPTAGTTLAPTPVQLDAAYEAVLIAADPNLNLSCARLDCDSGGRARKISLYGHNNFTLRSQIGGLSALTDLALYYLPGTVPTQFGLLSNLVSFTLVDWTGQQLVGVPTVTATSLPSTINIWTRLRTLTLGAASLLSLPTQVGLLTALETLRLVCPNMVGLPAQLGNVRSLSEVSLQINGGSLPAGWASNTFQSIVASSNFTGTIPLFTFDGAPGGCSLRRNKFDNATSLCPRFCDCDNDIVLQPPLTLPSRSATQIMQTSSGPSVAPALTPGTISTIAGGTADEPTDWMLIALIAVGSVLVAVLVFVGVYCVGVRRRRGNVAQSAAPTEMHTARADSLRALSAAGDPGAHYGIVQVANPSSHYLEHAGEFKVAQSEPHQYAALSATEASEQEPHYTVPTTPPVSAASAEPEPPYDVLSDEEAGRATG
jgi:hypothetical protein